MGRRALKSETKIRKLQLEKRLLRNLVKTAVRELVRIADGSAAGMVVDEAANASADQIEKLERGIP
jgi:hypothetical protein